MSQRSVTKRLKLIVGITGMPGAGKSTVALYANNMGFSVVSLGDAVREESVKRGLSLTDANLGLMMLKLREESGPGAVAQLALPKVISSDKAYVLIDGIRSIQEVKVLKKVAPVKLLTLHASPETRYRYLRDRSRGDAPLTWETFQARDERELAVGIGEAIALSDEVISNNDITIDELQKRAYEVIYKWMVQVEG